MSYTLKTPPNQMKTVLITGCSRGGIGAALVNEFLNRNFHVFATARSVSKMDYLENVTNVTLIKLDVTSLQSIKTAVSIVSEKTGGTLDVLVNNSGLNATCPFTDVVLEEARDLFEVNFWGVLRVTQEFTPLIIAAKGTIVNNSSVAAVLNRPFFSMYQASKAALTSFSETLRIELKPFGVRVICLHTGGVKSQIFENTQTMVLPPNSLYRSMEDRLQAIVSGEYAKGMLMDTETYARKVVDDVVHSSHGIVWRGAYSSVIAWMVSFLPTFVMDKMGEQQIGLSSFKPDHSNSKDINASVKKLK